MSLAAKPKRRPNPQGKQRAGRHHKHNEHYLKTYWPYLPLIAVIGLGFVLNSFWTPHKGVLGYATDMSVGSLLQDTNTQRTGNGLASLALNSQLNQAAQNKANDMATRDYWSHNTPDGSTPWSFITAAGYSYQTAGENLAYGFDTSSDTVTAWMNSPEHRANILNGTYKDVGFGIANAANYQGTGPETIVVAEYASPQAVAAAPAPSPASTPSTPAASTPSSSTPTTPTPTPAATAQPKETTTTPAPQTTKAKTATPKATTTQNISRIQLLADSSAAPWSAFAVSTLVVVCAAVFLLRHGLVWHRVLRRGEKFVLKHRMLDVALVTVAVLGVVLTRSVGAIR